jgi:hypothetical protein
MNTIRTTWTWRLAVILVLIAAGLAATAAAPAAQASTRICFRVGVYRTCVTKHARYDRVCITIPLGGYSITRCHRRWH